MIAVELKAAAAITEFYALDAYAPVSATSWTNRFAAVSSQHTDFRTSGFVAVRDIGNGKTYLYCEFNVNMRAVVQVFCRHLGYQMGVLRKVNYV